MQSGESQMAFCKRETSFLEFTHVSLTCIKNQNSKTFLVDDYASILILLDQIAYSLLWANLQKRIKPKYQKCPFFVSLLLFATMFMTSPNNALGCVNSACKCRKKLFISFFCKYKLMEKQIYPKKCSLLRGEKLPRNRFNIGTELGY